MHTILIPVDGSIHAIKAVHIGCDLSDKYGGSIVLCHSLLRNKKPQAILDLKMAETLDNRLVIALRNLAALQNPKPIPAMLLTDIGQQILHTAEEQVRRRSLEPRSLDMFSGDAADDILEAARIVNANTIVMGCRGVRSTQPGHFGSVSQRVFAESACTCIAVK